MLALRSAARRLGGQGLQAQRWLLPRPFRAVDEEAQRRLLPRTFRVVDEEAQRRLLPRPFHGRSWSTSSAAGYTPPTSNSGNQGLAVDERAHLVQILLQGLGVDEQACLVQILLQGLVVDERARLVQNLLQGLAVDERARLVQNLLQGLIVDDAREARADAREACADVSQVRADAQDKEVNLEERKKLYLAAIKKTFEKADSYGERAEKLIYTPQRIIDFKKSSEENSRIVSDAFAYFVLLAFSALKFAKEIVKEMKENSEDCDDPSDPGSFGD